MLQKSHQERTPIVSLKTPSIYIESMCFLKDNDMVAKNTSWKKKTIKHNNGLLTACQISEKGVRKEKENNSKITPTFLFKSLNELYMNRQANLFMCSF